MLSNIYRYIEPLRNVYLSTVKADQFVDNMFNKATNFIERSYKVSNPTITSGIETLLTILFKCDLDTLLRSDSHEDRLFYIRTYVLPMFESYATTTDDVLPYGNQFVSRGRSIKDVTEILTISFNSHHVGIYAPYTNTPAVKRSSYLQDGKDVKFETIINNFEIPIFANKKDFNLRPFEITSIDSTELSIDLRSTLIRFKQSVPTFSTFNIDIEKLVMAALYYADRHQPSELINWHKFIYQFCILPSMIDTVNQWLINILSFTINQKLVLDPQGRMKTSDLKIDYSPFFEIATDNDFLFPTRDNFTKTLEILTDKLVLNQITPDVVLDNYKLATYDSIIGFVDHMIKDIEPFNSIDQLWRVFMTQLPVLTLIINMYKLNPSHHRTRNLMIHLNRYLLNVSRYNFSSKIRDHLLRERLKEQLTVLIEYTDPNQYRTS